MPEILLCSDLDRTILSNGSQPESPQARPILRRLAGRQGVTLAYVSGRSKVLDVLPACSIANWKLSFHSIIDDSESSADRGLSTSESGPEKQRSQLLSWVYEISSPLPFSKLTTRNLSIR